MSVSTDINRQVADVPVSETDQRPDEPKRVSDADLTDDERIDAAAARILKRYKSAFEKLAK